MISKATIENNRIYLHYAHITSGYPLQHGYDGQVYITLSNEEEAINLKYDIEEENNTLSLYNFGGDNNALKLSEVIDYIG